MSFSIPGVSISAPLPPIPPAPAATAPTVDPVGSPSVSPSGAPGVSAPDTGLNFGESLSNAMERLGALHENADALATKVATWMGFQILY